MEAQYFQLCGAVIGMLAVMIAVEKVRENRRNRLEILTQSYFEGL